MVSQKEPIDHRAMKRLAIDYRAWALTLLLLAVDAAWLVHGGWSVAPGEIAITLLALTGFASPMLFKRYRCEPRINATACTAALLVLFTNVSATLSYLVVSTNAPLVDSYLASLDRALGFDWRCLQGWIDARPVVHAALAFAYGSGLAQIVGVVLFLGFTARLARMEEFVWLFIVATVLTIAVSGPFPAAGPWKHYALGTPPELSMLSHFEPLRDGSLRHIPLAAMQGLIAVPSLHAATAVLLVHAMRGTGIPFFVVTTLNAAMIASTPTEGGHYFADVLAGTALALGLIAVLRRRAALAPIGKRRTRQAETLGGAHP
jgi:hypothetical protein